MATVQAPKVKDVSTVGEPLLDDNPDRYCMFPIKYPVSVASVWRQQAGQPATGQGRPQHEEQLLRQPRPSCACCCTPSSLLTLHPVPAGRLGDVQESRGQLLDW